MKRSYQHCAVQRLNHAHPESAVLVLVRSVNTGAPVATSSLRKSREYWPPVLLCPSCTYMRVLPFGSAVTANAARVWMIAGFSDGLICVHVAPPSGERQMPRAYDEA